MSALLSRQIRKYLPDFTKFPDEIQGELEDFFRAVDDAYAGFEKDRNLMERSLDLTSHELRDQYNELRHDADKQKKMVTRLQSMIAALKQDTLGIDYDENNTEDLVGLLERIIRERTTLEQDLTIRAKSLEELNRHMVGRELKMVELKKENNRLRKRLEEAKLETYD